MAHLQKRDEWNIHVHNYVPGRTEWGMLRMCHQCLLMQCLRFSSPSSTRRKSSRVFENLVERLTSLLRVRRMGVSSCLARYREDLIDSCKARQLCQHISRVLFLANYVQLIIVDFISQLEWWSQLDWVGDTLQPHSLQPHSNPKKWLLLGNQPCGFCTSRIENRFHLLFQVLSSSWRSCCKWVHASSSGPFIKTCQPVTKYLAHVL